MRQFCLTIILLLLSLTVNAQVELQTSDLTGTYKYTVRNVKGYGIHDPSVIWDPATQYFYVYGSHYSGAKTQDLRTWTGITKYYAGGYDASNAYKAFRSCPAHTIRRVLPNHTDVEEVTLPSYDAGSFSAIYSSSGVGSWVSGNQWAPDIVYNPNTEKWNYYLSLNGDHWASVIVLMTGDSPTGPFTYEGPIVFGGFNGQGYDVEGTPKKVDYKNTDLEIVLGPQSFLPGRYSKGNSWGSFWPNCIDPCAFFDAEGELWLTYGSWSGGIWMLKLDKHTGLRDYTYTYPGTASSVSSQQRSDTYFGQLIAGGAYVSGEGSYIQPIGDYYYLFMSYGFYAPDGGYEMRIFRSESPTGPYVDASGNEAVNTSYQMNYGPKAATNKGMKIIGSYNGWGTQALGECAQGHNSVCRDDKGRTFLVCHTKFTDGTAAHALRVHQLFLNEAGWLCAAPFQFKGETWTDDSIANRQPWTAADIEGDYHLLIHPYKLDYENHSVSTPKTIHLSASGKITGDYTGTWTYSDEGKSFLQIKLGNTVYHGVVSEQTIQGGSATDYQNITSSAKALCFSAICSTKGNTHCGVPIWGYKMQPQYAIAYNYQTHADYFMLLNYANISKNVDMMFAPVENVQLTWTSSAPEVVSHTGKYNPKDEDVPLTLTATLACGNYFWTKTFASVAKAATEVIGDQRTGLVAYYDFDEKPTLNLYNEEQRIAYGRSSTTGGEAPTLETDWSRFGKVVHQYFAPRGSNSYSRIPNPLKAQDLEGITVSLWVKRTDDNKWDALWSFFNETSSTASGPRLYLSGNAYVGFNDNAGNWFDINHPDTKSTTLIKHQEWHLVTVTLSQTNGVTLYIDGTSKFKKSSAMNCAYNGSAAKDAFDYARVLEFVKRSQYFYLGLGSFWGSADACFDDLMLYNRELTADDVKGLHTVLSRVNAMGPVPTAIEEAPSDYPNASKQPVYDLSGREVLVPSHGVYIVNGKKILFPVSQRLTPL